MLRGISPAIYIGISWLNFRSYFLPEGRPMDGKERKFIHPGVTVDIVLKKDQRTGKLTRGVVGKVLTRSARHPHGIKVRLHDGQVGRVKKILE